MKTRPLPAAWMTVLAATYLAPALALGGPDDPARPPRSSAAPVQYRFAPPPPVTERQTAVTTTTTETHEDIIQPLRQREESVNYRLGYRALTELGLAGSEFDDKPIGYEQIYGPTPMRIYRQPPPPRPRRFRHSADLTEKLSAQPSPTLDSKPLPSPAPVSLTPDPAGPTGSPAASPVPMLIPGDQPEAGILPDPAQEAARGRNDELLSYFQRPRTTRTSRATQPPALLPPVGGYGNGNGYGAGYNNGYNGGAGYGNDPVYLQAPEQIPLPPSSATYRVVPK